MTAVLNPATEVLQELARRIREGDLRSAIDAGQLAKLAHELKTPLTAIVAAAEVMRDERLGAMGNSHYLGYAADIHESATHALDVIAALLAEGSRPASVSPQPRSIDLGTLVERTVSTVRALAESRGLALVFDRPPNETHVAAEPTALRQILLNLLTNAIKFTPRGGEVRVIVETHADGRALLQVRDTGCGMDGGDRAIALNLPSSELWLTSNGIGLPLVEQLIDEMGAEFALDSTPYEGTTASITFACPPREPSKTAL
ncbi:hypothetical protein DLM45_09245 [Hyphomicrobium methylovorum]|uniref:sensor histidine kinase n=1 Tax=Hyphomicrobium methylovorum TaxID=84 RepID=UPI0015E65297|nr:HAMP domain-containing sensor histidine kinase [Hyphomicrobium methylovorum]MBA2126408.1 hypothetical protein [Hyphomicrobium methylovorum]